MREYSKQKTKSLSFLKVVFEFIRSCLGTVCGLKDLSLARKVVNNSQSRGLPKMYGKGSSKGVY